MNGLPPIQLKEPVERKSITEIDVFNLPPI